MDWRHLISSKRPSKKRSSSKSKRSRKKSVFLKKYSLPFLRFSLKWAAVTAVIVGIGLAGVVFYYSRDLPEIESVVTFKRRPTTTILASDGTLISRHGDFYGTPVNAKDMPEHLIEAILATEDRRFYNHFGIDIIGLVRAMSVNLIEGRLVQGGSTITQQLAKNLFLSPDRTLKRKIQEAILALQLERRFTKNQILSAYLNRVYLGSGAYGIDAAARTYFNKPAKDVTVREAAVLAGLLKAPSRYAPSINPDEAATRTKTVLEAMIDAGYLEREEVIAMGEIPHLPRRKPAVGEGAQYFADWVAYQVSSYAGYEVKDIIVKTTLDPHLQRIAEQHVKALLDQQGEKMKASQAALVTLSPDGAIRAMVGGRVYQDSQFNRATQALRQPGSAFKPIVFLAALESGMTPTTEVEDAPIEIKDWKPENFEKEYQGSVPLHRALALSLNTVAVRVMQQVGVNNVRSMARRLGITAQLGQDMSLALGTSEVTLLELTAAYATLANLGTAIWPYAITEVKDSTGQILYKREADAATQVVEPMLVDQLNKMMTGVIEYGTGAAAQLDRPAAGKTGTSQDYRDAWLLGFTSDYITGVWVGNDDNSPMKRVTGGSLPAIIWRSVMRDAQLGMPVQALKTIENTSPQFLGNTAVESEIPANDPEPVLEKLEGLLGRIIGN